MSVNESQIKNTTAGAIDDDDAVIFKERKRRCDGIFCESPRQTEKQQSLSLFKDYSIVIIDCAGGGVFDL